MSVTRADMAIRAWGHHHLRILAVYPGTVVWLWWKVMGE